MSRQLIPPPGAAALHIISAVLYYNGILYIHETSVPFFKEEKTKIVVRANFRCDIYFNCTEAGQIGGDFRCGVVWKDQAAIGRMGVRECYVCRRAV